MVEHIVGPSRCAAEPQAVASMVASCGRLPLALRIAANRLATRPDWPIQHLVDRLSDQHRRLDELRAGDLTVRGPFEVSYAQLNEPTATLYRRLALIDGPDFDATLAAALSDLDTTTAEDILDELVDASLLEPAGPDSTNVSPPSCGTGAPAGRCDRGQKPTPGSSPRPPTGSAPYTAPPPAAGTSRWSTSARLCSGTATCTTSTASGYRSSG